jgi:hypothetical protein
MKGFWFVTALQVLGLCNGTCSIAEVNDCKYLCSLTIIAPTQEQPGVTVPEKIRTTFSSAYPNAEVNAWMADGDNYKVLFKDQNMQQAILYDPTGKVIRKETELDNINVPGGITQYYKKTYPDETNYKVWLIEDDKRKQTYSTTQGDQILYFDSDGKYIRSEKRLIQNWDKDQKKIRKNQNRK